MRIVYVILFVVLGHIVMQAQTTNPNLLVNIHKASQTEIDAYNTADLEIGMLVYNTNENRIYEYTNTGFVELLTGQSTYVGQFIINGTGEQTITGIPFKPSSIIMVAHANVESLVLDDDNGTRDNDNGIANSFGTMNGFARQDGANITQQVIYVGASGNSVNDISRYASNNQCIGLRYGNQNGDDIGKITARLSAFTDDGFRINVSEAADKVIVLYTVYR